MFVLFGRYHYPSRYHRGSVLATPSLVVVTVVVIYGPIFMTSCKHVYRPFTNTVRHCTTMYPYISR